MSVFVTGYPRIITPTGSGTVCVPFKGRTTYLIVRGAGKIYFTAEDAAAATNGFPLSSGQFAGPADATCLWADNTSGMTIVAFIKSR